MDKQPQRARAVRPQGANMPVPPPDSTEANDNEIRFSKSPTASQRTLDRRAERKVWGWCRLMPHHMSLPPSPSRTSEPCQVDFLSSQASVPERLLEYQLQSRTSLIRGEWKSPAGAGKQGGLDLSYLTELGEIWELNLLIAIRTARFYWKKRFGCQIQHTYG